MLAGPQFSTNRLGTLLLSWLFHCQRMLKYSTNRPKIPSLSTLSHSQCNMGVKNFHKETRNALIFFQSPWIFQFCKNKTGTLSSFHFRSIKKSLLFSYFFTVNDLINFFNEKNKNTFTFEWIFSPWKKSFRGKVKHNCLSQLFSSCMIWSRDRKFGRKWKLNFCGITQFHPNLNAGTNANIML